MRRVVGCRNARRTAGRPSTKRAARHRTSKPAAKRTRTRHVAWFLTARPAAKRTRTRLVTGLTTVVRRGERDVAVQANGSRPCGWGLDRQRSTWPAWNLPPSTRGPGDRRLSSRVRPLPLLQAIPGQLLSVLRVPFYVVYREIGRFSARKRSTLDLGPLSAAAARISRAGPQRARPASC
jgi:hypothetical protein